MALRPTCLLKTSSAAKVNGVKQQRAFILAACR